MKKNLLLLIGFFVCLSSFGQFNYQAANALVSSGTYTDLGATGAAITTNSAATAMTYDDDNSSTQSIGFNFVFNGSTYTQFVLNSNGFIKLGATAPLVNTIYNVLTSTETDLIAPFSIDLEGGTSPEYRVFTTGSAGAKVCTIQFKNVKDWSATVGQYTNINFQIKLYETSNNVEFVYGNFTASAAAAAFIATTAGIKGTTATSSVNATKASATAWSGTTFIDGSYTGNAFNNRNNILPTAGLTLKFVAVTLPANDAKVMNIYTLGKIPASFGAQTIKAVVKNAGAGLLTNISVSLNVTGANTFTDNQIIASLAAGATATVAFASFNPANAGINAITVAVPVDGDNTNNIASVSQTITTNIVSTAYAVTTLTGVGNTSAIEISSKFSNTGTKTIDQIGLYFPATSTGQPYIASIYDASGAGGLPGATALWTSTAQTTAGANVNLAVSPVVTVNGDFYVGVTQTGVANFGYGYETENPLRTGTFFIRVPAGTWGDLSATATNVFKLMMDVRFASGVVPITLNSFTGSRANNNNILNWATATEANNNGFELQRSADGKEFSTLSFVKSKGENGNSNSSLKYQYVDESAFTTVSYYRLKQVDKDGKSTLSDVVTIKGDRPTKFELVNLYPNPAKEKLNVVLAAPKSSAATLVVTDIAGKIVLQQTTQLNSGDNNIAVNVAALKTGNYTIKVVCAEGCETAVKKFIKD